MGLITERKMARKARQRSANELNLVSMIDVLTVLVFFLLVNTMNVTTLSLDFPSPNTKPALTEVQPLSLELQANSLLVTHGAERRSIPHMGDSYDMAALNLVLSDIKNSHPDQSSATVLVAPGIAYGELVAVMDAVRVGGLSGRTLFPHISLGDAAINGKGPQ